MNTTTNKSSGYIILTVKQLEQMLKNAKAGGLSEIKFTLSYEVINR